MLGGGVFVTQNKILPGSYINFVNASKATATLGERGVVAIALPLSVKEGEIIEITRAEFIKDCKTINLLPALLMPLLFFLVRSLFV